MTDTTGKKNPLKELKLFNGISPETFCVVATKRKAEMPETVLLLTVRQNLHLFFAAIVTDRNVFIHV